MKENFIEKIQASYIKNIKRYMPCPSCGDKLRINKKGNVWKCDKCDYKLSHKKFENGYVFWFCDKCNTFLNNQEGFNYKDKTFCCTKCGHKNDITVENIKNICKDCGAVLAQDSKFGLCSNCLQLRTDKWKSRLKTGFKILLGLGAAAGLLYLSAKSADDSDDSNDDMSNDDLNEKSYPICKTCGAEMTGFDGWAWYTCPDCEDKVRIIDGKETWYDDIFKSGTKHHNSDFELADFCHGGDLTED